MVDIWDDFSTKVQALVLSNESFDVDFHLNNVEVDADMPYAVMINGNIEFWMTFSQATAGENISFRVLLNNDVRGGGVSTLKDLTSEVVSTLHLQDFETDEFKTVSCKRTGWSQPVRVDEDALQWTQYVDFHAIIQYKSSSDYFS